MESEGGKAREGEREGERESKGGRGRKEREQIMTSSTAMEYDISLISHTQEY